MIVVDDFFPDADSIRNYSLDLDFHKPKKTDNWFGMRTSALSEIDYDFHEKIYNFFMRGMHVKDCLFYFHLLGEDYQFDKKYIHTDASTMAGLIYLSKNLNNNCGTIFFDNTGDNIEKTISPVYNSMVMYNSYIPHAPQGGCGTVKENMRLTLTFFLI